MLFSPIKYEPFRIISIDPGSREMGLSVIEVDPRNNDIHVVESGTFITDTFLRLRNSINHFGETVERQQIIAGILMATAERVKPHGFCAEDFYFQRNITAYRSLTECMLTARTTMREYNNYLMFMTFTASQVKKFINVNGGSNDKTLIKQAVLALKTIRFSPDIDLESLDQHAWDSIAIGYMAANEVIAQSQMNYHFQE